MSTTLVSPQVVKAKSLSCPNCGGPVNIRGFAHTLSVVCLQCLTVLDASNPQLSILQQFHGKLRMQPLIPLGTRGDINATAFEVIGFQYREVKGEEEGDTYGWSEYLLFNPYKGFRYFSEYNGHWNFIRVLSSVPEVIPGSIRKRIRYQGQSYAPFDAAQAKTAFVLGEFPWQVRVGETVHVEDFVSGQWMLSSETTDGEVTWSQGEYWKSQQVWQAFRLPGTPLKAVGTFANQPSPFAGKVRSAWRLWLALMAALIALAIIFTAIAPNREVFRHSSNFTPTPGEPAAFVTPDFELTGRTSNVAISTRTNLSNNWAYFNYALINVTTGAARDFGREISNYSSEGSPNDRVVIPAVPSGKYYLRVEPEMQAGQASSGVNYDIIVHRGVPTYGWLWIAGVLLTIPPIITTVRAARFEAARWRESEYAPVKFS